MGAEKDTQAENRESALRQGVFAVLPYSTDRRIVRRCPIANNNVGNLESIGCRTRFDMRVNPDSENQCSPFAS